MKYWRCRATSARSMASSACFIPKRTPLHPIGYDYLGDNSANFDGLAALESDIIALKPPSRPWAVDAKLAAEGEKIFNWTTAQGGCVECHGIKTLADGNWVTPVTPIAQIRTDAKELQNMGRKVDTGVLIGAFIPFLGEPLNKTDDAVSVLGLSVGRGPAALLPKMRWSRFAGCW